MTQARRPLPEGFIAAAATLTRTGLRQRFNMRVETVDRLCRENGITPRGSHRKCGKTPIPMPEDLAERAAAMTNKALREHYRCGRDTMSRWLTQAGVPMVRAHLIQRVQRAGQKVGRERTKASRPRFMAAAAATRRQFSTPQADVSLIAQAAQYLRRRHANVFRADILEPKERERLPNCGVGYYVVAGKGVLPANDVLSLAQDEGFDPRAWAVI